jgi:hypothetical protein
MPIDRAWDGDSDCQHFGTADLLSDLAKNSIEIHLFHGVQSLLLHLVASLLLLLESYNGFFLLFELFTKFASKFAHELHRPNLFTAHVQSHAVVG